MIITREHFLTGELNTRSMDVTQEQLDRWRNGELVQNAFPHLTDEERDFFVLGTTKEQWEKLYSDIREEE